MSLKTDDRLGMGAWSWRFVCIRAPVLFWRKRMRNLGGSVKELDARESLFEGLFLIMEFCSDRGD